MSTLIDALEEDFNSKREEYLLLIQEREDARKRLRVVEARILELVRELSKGIQKEPTDGR